MRSSVRQRGFSFAEVMFAVIILGVGFIMIAALFPVALRQTKSNGDETIAASQARGGTNVVAAIADNSSLLGNATGSAVTFPTFGSDPSCGTFTPQPTASFAVWQKLKGSLISGDDPRYAWVPIFIRRVDPLV